MSEKHLSTQIVLLPPKRGSYEYYVLLIINAERINVAFYPEGAMEVNTWMSPIDTTPGTFRIEPREGVEVLAWDHEEQRQRAVVSCERNGTHAFHGDIVTEVPHPDTETGAFVLCIMDHRGVGRDGQNLGDETLQDPRLYS